MAKHANERIKSFEQGGRQINLIIKVWYFDTLILWYLDTWLLWYFVTLILCYFEVPLWSPFRQTFKIPSSWVVENVPAPVHIHFWLLFLYLYEAFLHWIIIYCIYFCYIWRSCHLFTFSASRAAINTSGTRLKWNYSKLLWSTVCIILRSIALPYCSEQHSCHCQIMSQMLFDRGSTLAIKPIVLSSDSLCFERFQVLLQCFRHSPQ